MSDRRPPILATATLLASAAFPLLADDPAPPGPGSYPVSAPAAGRFDPFYAKMVDAGGIPVIGSERVSDFALKEAASLVDRMLANRPDVRKAMIANRARCVV